MSDTPSSQPISSAEPLVRWPSEETLFAFVLLASIAIWLALMISIVGIVYVVIIGLALFLAQVGFITHLRGNAVRLGPDQLPELHARVQEIAYELGLDPCPDAYLIQQGGELNALATKFFRSDFVVLFSDLIDACGDNADARDFIIAHELSHLRAGHLRWRWFLVPGFLVPFLGTAYSRACEYTCDGFAMTVARRRDAALEGLCILAVGPKQAARVNRQALAAQRQDLNTVWMKIGSWLATHPPIASRLAALDPALQPEPLREGRATAGALAVVGGAIAVPIAVVLFFVIGFLPQFQAAMQAARAQQAPAASGSMADSSGPGSMAAGASDAAKDTIARRGIETLVQTIEAERARSGSIPPNVQALYASWRKRNPARPEPIDPFDGKHFGYHIEGKRYYVWSSGPDPDLHEDDIVFSFEEGKP